ncbi:hypothetical protein [Brevundimonas diminuta]|uniref:hypothetical protein n=1 Tax=Brevundimonas diminuta TaxID=293 RepID=UPI0028A91FFB|nr:hypothetical protein [Brevundimonas diminuta]
MSLLDRSRALATDAKDLAARKSMADQVKAVAARRQAFGEARAMIMVAAAKRAALRSRGVDVVVDITSVLPLRRRLEAWKAEVTDNPALIVAPESTVQTQVIQPLRSLAKRLDESGLAGWRAYVDEHLPRIAHDTLRMRERLPGMKRKVEAFREAYSRASALADVVPTTEAGFAQFDARASACREAWAELEGEALPDDVRRFLHAAGQPGGASIEMLLTGDTLSWLRTQNLVEHFRIRGS